MKLKTITLLAAASLLLALPALYAINNPPVRIVRGSQFVADGVEDNTNRQAFTWNQNSLRSSDNHETLLSEFYFDMRPLTAFTNSWGIYLNATGLVLQSGMILAGPNTYAVYSPTAQTLDVRGIVSANRPYSPQITLAHGLYLNITSNVLLSGASILWAATSNALMTATNLGVADRTINLSNYVNLIVAGWATGNSNGVINLSNYTTTANTAISNMVASASNALSAGGPFIAVTGGGGTANSFTNMALLTGGVLLSNINWTNIAGVNFTGTNTGVGRAVSTNWWELHATNVSAQNKFTLSGNGQYITNGGTGVWEFWRGDATFVMRLTAASGTTMNSASAQGGNGYGLANSGAPGNADVIWGRESAGVGLVETGTGGTAGGIRFAYFTNSAASTNISPYSWSSWTATNVFTNLNRRSIIQGQVYLTLGAIGDSAEIVWAITNGASVRLITNKVSTAAGAATAAMPVYIRLGPTNTIGVQTNIVSTGTAVTMALTIEPE